jgi:hypothetical protein
MKTRVALLLALFSFCLISLSAAAKGQRLYPVQGPVAAQTPPPRFTAKLTNYLGTKRNISLVLANVESY